MKTLNKNDVYSWSNAEEAKQYIGKKGYFNNDFESMERVINLGGQAVLGRVDTNSIWCFEGLGASLCFGLFLPADKVKGVEEKKFRPFTVEEFLNRFSIGTKISFRRKDETRSIYGLFEGIRTDHERLEKYHLIICNLWYSLNELFNDYEYLDEHGDWQPFGVEVEE